MCMTRIEFEKYCKQVKEGKKWCYDCKKFAIRNFCGNRQGICKVKSSLDFTRKLFEPDYSADICEEYENNGKEHWFEKCYYDI